MPGNSSRRGAIKKTGKGNPTAGSGGRVKRALTGKGPTPKATDRPYHQAYRTKAKAERAAVGRGGGTRGGRPGGRKGGDSEWVAGRNSVVEALRANIPVTALYVAEGAERDGRLKEAFQIASDRGLAMLEVPRSEMDKMTAGAVHQGLALRVPAYEYAHPGDLIDLAVERKESALIVALDQVTDPRNLGAVVRSAAGFGAHGVLVPERRAAGMTASAWKTSAGAAARVPVAQAVNLVRELKGYRAAGCTIVGLAADGDLSLPELVSGDLATGPLVLVIGSEDKGLGRLVAENCDHLVSIPMSGVLESLNASVAASIVLYAIDQARS